MPKISRSILSLSATLLFGISSISLADFMVVKDLKPEASSAVIDYMKKDPTCHSARGNSRDAGVSYLEQVRDSVTGQDYMRGQVWANSDQTWNSHGVVHVYGDALSSVEKLGYTEVSFLFPVRKNAGVWTGNFDHIVRDTNDETEVPQITPISLRQGDLSALSFHEKCGAILLYQGAKNNLPNYPTLQIDLGQVFEQSKTFLLADDA